MKKDDLLKLGLSEEQIDGVFKLNGLDVNAEKEKAEAVKKERDALQGKLKEANAVIEKTKELDVEKIQESANEWQKKAQEFEQQLIQTRNNATLDKKLSGYKSHDAETLKKLLDFESLTFDGKDVKGLDEQVKALQENKPWLFIEPESDGKPKEQETPDGFNSFIPRGSDDNTGAKTTMQQQVDAIMNG